MEYMAKPKPMIIAARFHPRLIPIIEEIAKRHKVTPSKWLEDLAMGAVNVQLAKIGPVETMVADFPAVEVPKTPSIGGGMQGVAFRTPDPLTRIVPSSPTTVEPPVASQPPTTKLTWQRPAPPPKPSWAKPAAQAQEKPAEPIVPKVQYSCDVCQDQGAGVLKECVCGRYRDQQGNVQMSPDGPPTPSTWAEAWEVMSKMDNVDRAEKFFAFCGGTVPLPEEWSSMPKELKIDWLTVNVPIHPA